MATAPYQIMQPAMLPHGEPPLELLYPEASGQSFKRGEIVYLVDGELTEIAGNTPTQILGVAAQNASGTQYNLIPVWVADGNTIFEANSTSGGSSSTVVAADIGKWMGLYRDTSGSRTFIDRAVQTAASSRVIVVGISPKDLETIPATGTPVFGGPAYQTLSIVNATNGRYLFKFMACYCQLARTS